MPISQMSGPHTDLADLPFPPRSAASSTTEDYIARLHQIPRVFTQTEEVLRAGMKDHLMPVRFLLEKIPGQCQGIIASNPFLLPTKKYPASISAADQQRLTQQITDIVNNEVLPAYKAFASFVATEYAPHGRTTLSVASLPGGEARYRHDIKQLHHYQQSHSRPDPPARAAGDGSHRGPNARDRPQRRICRRGLLR